MSKINNGEVLDKTSFKFAVEVEKSRLDCYFFLLVTISFILTYLMPMRVDKWVFLDTSLEESLRRIKIRNREAETGVSVEYQTALYNKHVEFYNQLKDQGAPVLNIDNSLMDDNFINNSKTLETISSKIMEF